MEGLVTSDEEWQRCASNSTVTVTIGGTSKAAHQLSVTLEHGSVVIQSAGHVPVIASEHMVYFDASARTSFIEMISLP